MKYAQFLTGLQPVPAVTKKNGTGKKWLFAVILALCINGILFGLMPGLLRPVTQNPRANLKTRQFEVIPPATIQPPVASRKERQLPKEKEYVAKTPTPSLPPLDYSMDTQTTPEQVTLPAPDFRTQLTLSPKDIFIPPVAIPVSADKSRSFYEVEELDQPIVPVVQAPPIYPMRAKRRGIVGQVGVEFLVNPEGTTENIVITKASPPGFFEQAVIRCVSAWRFAPGRVKGSPVSVKVSTTIRFELD